MFLTAGCSLTGTVLWSQLLGSLPGFPVQPKHRHWCFFACRENCSGGQKSPEIHRSLIFVSSHAKMTLPSFFPLIFTLFFNTAILPIVLRIAFVHAKAFISTLSSIQQRLLPQHGAENKHLQITFPLVTGVTEFPYCQNYTRGKVTLSHFRKPSAAKTRGYP